MRIILAGGTGFLGRALAARLIADGHTVVVLSRRPADAADGAVRRVRWNPDGTVPPAEAGQPTGWAREIDGADAIVNLAGEGIADRRWTRARKQALLDSRRLSTRSLVAAIRAASRRPAVFVQNAGIGYYGLGADEVFDESSPPGSDFLARLSVDWEAEARAVEALGCRLVILRTAVVLAREGGALKRMLPAFQFFVGGPIASGLQYFSWIDRDDWLALVAWALATPSVTGAINAAAPEPVTNAEFAKALGR
ncbi:MAG TPA: TIGR01777 family oxidoreductase, partial [Vicinamibacterales bacterium]|nr:TIGR01777 family oxidoreductase [Vicinamibacterales bacterium]